MAWEGDPISLDSGNPLSPELSLTTRASGARTSPQLSLLFFGFAIWPARSACPIVCRRRRERPRPTPAQFHEIARTLRVEEKFHSRGQISPHLAGISSLGRRGCSQDGRLREGRGWGSGTGHRRRFFPSPMLQPPAPLRVELCSGEAAASGAVDGMGEVAD